jgi:hypothetical protein
MVRMTVGFGVALVVVGVGAYLVTGGASVTALIPAFVGVPMVVAGLLMARPRVRPVGFYSALALALLMALSSLRGVAGLLGGEVSGPALIQLVLFVASIGFLVVAAREVRAGRWTGAR